MITVDAVELYRLERLLGHLNKKGLPYAMRETLNDAAFKTMNRGRDNLADKMTLRNTWTQRQVRVDRARGTNPDLFRASVGAEPHWLAKQEFGGTVRHPIPTSYSSGEGYSSHRKRLPRKPNKLKNIKLTGPRPKGQTRQQRNAAAVLSGEKYIWLDLGDRKGIFRVLSPKSKRPKVRMVWSVDGKRRKVPKREWLKPAFDKTVPEMPNMFGKQLRKQIRRVYQGGKW